MIDSNDRERFEESLEELNAILENPEIPGVPVVVLANKQDLPNATSCSQIAEALHLHKLTHRYSWHLLGYRSMCVWGALVAKWFEYTIWVQ